MIAADLSGPVPWIVLAVATVLFLYIDFRFYRPGERPDLREAAIWTLVWTAVAVAAALPLWLFSSGSDAIAYLTVYVVTRALSFDNLVVFIILLAYFGIRHQQRNKLLAQGIIGMLILRGAAILGGLALIHRLQVSLPRDLVEAWGGRRGQEHPAVLRAGPVGRHELRALMNAPIRPIEGEAIMPSLRRLRRLVDHRHAAIPNCWRCHRLRQKIECRQRDQ